MSLESFRSEGEHVLEGVLRDTQGNWIPIIDGVPSFLDASMRRSLGKLSHQNGIVDDRCSNTQSHRRSVSDEQARTTISFSDKWSRFKSYGLEAEHEEFLFGWYCRKLGLPTRDALAEFYSTKKRILECGTGSGFKSRFMSQHCNGEVFALDISAAAHTTFENTKDLQNCLVVQADLMKAPFPDEYFDFIMADGVLHHTPSTRLAVEALYKKLAPGGTFFFYVYKKMGAARMFVDQHIRSQFVPMSAEDCYKACEALTELGRELSALNAKVTLTKPIPSLGIPAGVHDVQRLVYYNFLKCFWNDAFDFETNNMVNFDWYHPHSAWQHTEDEVRQWLELLKAEDVVFNDANPNGLSVLIKKPSVLKPDKQ